MATEQRRHWTLKREYQERAILGLEELPGSPVVPFYPFARV